MRGAWRLAQCRYKCTFSNSWPPHGCKYCEMKVDRAKTLVVLVDDDRAFLRALGRLVSLAGFTVLAFDRPADVLKAPLPDEGGCIVLDLFMQEMDGTALFDRLLAAGNRLPVIVITGRQDQHGQTLIDRIEHAGVLYKPFGISELVVAIATATGTAA
jgi:FixJ family two-component response regulator